jgi:predicted Zn-dependent protease
MAQIKGNLTGDKMGPALLTRVKAVAMHEMGHALGLLHSDSEDDIMFPQYKPGITKARASTRDLRTVDTLYTLPNGAMVQ